MKKQILNHKDTEDLIKILKRRRSRKSLIKKRLLSLSYLILIISILFVISVFAKQNKSKPPITYTHVVIQRGDTLWDYAKKYYPDKDTRNAVWEIKKLNKLPSSNIYEGQVLKVPDIIDNQGK